MIASIADIRIGDLVKVYGKMTVGLLDGKWTMTIHKIEKTYEKSVSRTAYSVISGKTVDKEKAAAHGLTVAETYLKLAGLLKNSASSTSVASNKTSLDVTIISDTGVPHSKKDLENLT